MALATNTSPGEIQLAGDLAGNNDATAPELTDLGITAGQYQYPAVTVDAKGRITNITAGDPTTLSALLPAASATTRGTVQAGLGLSVNQNATAGYQEVTYGTAIDGSEVTNLSSCASYSITFTIDFGTPQIIDLSSVNLSTINDIINQINLVLIGAFGTVVGGNVRFTSNSTGRLSLVEINDDKVFKCSLGFNTVTAFVNGLQSCEMNGDIATGTGLGIVKIGSGLSIDGSGVLSTNIATISSLGTVQIGAGLSIDVAGVLSANALDDATTSSKGIVQIGSGINVSVGIISAVIADNTTKGVVNSANTNNITITSGGINIGPNVALLNVSNNWTTAQVVAPVTLTSAPNIATNASLSNNFNILLDQNAVLDNPTNIEQGARYSFVITQDAIGAKSLTYGSVFKFKNGSDTTLSTAANAVDILTCISDGTNLYCSLAKEFI